MRNLLSAAHHRHRQVIAALIRTVFAQPDADSARTQLRAVVDQLAPYAPAVAERLQAMEDDLLAYTAFPPGHWSNACSIASGARVFDEGAGVSGMTPLASAFVASASQCLPGDLRLVAVA
jgi:transposase-like protein